MHGKIVQNLGTDIVGGKMQPGERLPPDGKLGETYGVSRPVVREAIRVLAAKGLVVSKPRIGSVVRPKTEWHMLDPDVLFWTVSNLPQGAFFLELMAVRRIIEPAEAEIAARNATEEDLQRIEAAYLSMEAAQTPEELLEPDLEFHREIAVATHNDLLIYISKMLSLGLTESIKLTSRHPKTHALSLPRHKAILAALRSRDPLSARHASIIQLESAAQDADSVLELSPPSRY